MAAIDKAIYYLNIKPRTKAQVIRYLEQKDFPPEEIQEAIQELESYRYIDDFNYAQMYFEVAFEKGKGIARIKRELAEKGVDRQIIEEAFEELESVPDQYETALQTGRKILLEAGEFDPDQQQKIKGRIARRLASKGFSSDIVYSVIRELMD